MAADADQELIDLFEDALVVLVSDGAHPSQEHVRLLRDAYARAAPAIAARLAQAQGSSTCLQ